jgi:CO dehydrogenase/acetyl-CoA synthase beta subunit
MIQTAINLQEALNSFCEQYQEESIVDDILTDEDWKVLEEIRAFLEQLTHSTKALESSASCIDLTLPVIEYILKAFETTKENNCDHKVLSPMLNSGWSTFNKYYQLTDETYTYATALVLNPWRK